MIRGASDAAKAGAACRPLFGAEWIRTLKSGTREARTGIANDSHLRVLSVVDGAGAFHTLAFQESRGVCDDRGMLALYVARRGGGVLIARLARRSRRGWNLAGCMTECRR